MIALQHSRTNISEQTRTCVGTDERPCSITIDATAGKMRCSACRYEQQLIAQRRRNAISNAKRRTDESEDVLLSDGKVCRLRVRPVSGISGLARMGVTGFGSWAIVVIREDEQWREISMEEIDQKIAEKTRIYLELARKHLTR